MRRDECSKVRFIVRRVALWEIPELTHGPKIVMLFASLLRNDVTGAMWSLGAAGCPNWIADSPTQTVEVRP